MAQSYRVYEYPFTAAIIVEACRVLPVRPFIVAVNVRQSKLREAAQKQEKRQKKLRSEARAHTDRLRSRQKSLLLGFRRSGSKDRGSSVVFPGSERGGGMLESMPCEILWQVLPVTEFLIG